jgi:hypothetical protein
MTVLIKGQEAKDPFKVTVISGIFQVTTFKSASNFPYLSCVVSN